MSNTPQFKLPDGVSIIGKPWRVSRQMPSDVPENALGWTTSTQRTIFVRDLAPDVTAQVFCHELVHAVLLDTGVHNFLTNKEQEAIADAMAPLLMVVRDGHAF